jgi:hypothetical protein
MLSWIFVLISIPFLMLGAHGLYAYFHPLETLFSSTQDRLFFAISVPTQVSGLVNWMSLKGFQSFFVPAVFVACGIGLIWWAKNRGFHFSLPSWGMANKHQSKNKFGNYPNKTKSGFRPMIIKTILSLSVIVGIVILVWFGYRLFAHETSPLSGSITFLVGLGTIFGLIWLLRKKYIWHKPSFRMVTLVIVIIAVVFAFAGVKPFQAYKDNLIGVFSDKSNTSSVTNPTQQITRFSTGSVTWEVVLKSVKWNGARINTEIIATNTGKTPADFPYEDVDPNRSGR